MRTLLGLTFLVVVLAIGVGLTGIAPMPFLAAWRAGDATTDADGTTSAPGAEPSAVSARRARAEALLAAGQLDAAYELYQANVQEDPQDAASLRQLALIDLLLYRWDDASTHGSDYLRLRGEVDGGGAVAAALAYVASPGSAAAQDAATSASSILEIRPEDLMALWVVIQSLLASDNACVALPYIDQAIAQAPNLYALEELKLGAYTAIGDTASGVRQLEHMHRKFPDNLQVAEWLIQSYEATGDTTRAADVLRHLSGLDPADPGPVLRLVDLIRRAEGDKAADAELARRIEEADGAELATDYRLILASNLSGRGELQEAAKILEETLAALEATSRQREAAKVELARVRDASGQDREAMALLDEVLVEDPTNVEALQLRGRLRIASGQTREALDDLRLAMDQAPESTGILTLLARAYELEGSDALAMDSLARAVEISNFGKEEVALYAEFLNERGRHAAAEALLGMVQPEAAEPDSSVPAPAPIATSPACDAVSSSEVP